MLKNRIRIFVLVLAVFVSAPGTSADFQDSPLTWLVEGEAVGMATLGVAEGVPVPAAVFDHQGAGGDPVMLEFDQFVEGFFSVENLPQEELMGRTSALADEAIWEVVDFYEDAGEAEVPVAFILPQPFIAPEAAEGFHNQLAGDPNGVEGLGIQTAVHDGDTFYIVTRQRALELAAED